MTKLNTLTNTDTIIGQLYANGRATEEVMAVQYGAAVGLNCGRHWKDISCAGHEFYILPIGIELLSVAKAETSNVFIPARPLTFNNK